MTIRPGTRGKSFSASEDEIVKEHVAKLTMTRDFVHFLPGRSIATINSRARALGLPRTANPNTRRIPPVHRNVYLDTVLNDMANKTADRMNLPWHEFARAAVEAFTLANGDAETSRVIKLRNWNPE
jgi:hypothetical protein